MEWLKPKQSEHVNVLWTLQRHCAFNSAQHVYYNTSAVQMVFMGTPPTFQHPQWKKHDSLPHCTLTLVGLNTSVLWNRLQVWITGICSFVQRGTRRALPGIGMNFLESLSDPMPVQWALDTSWCTAAPVIMWQKYAGSSWRMKELIALTGHLTSIQWNISHLRNFKLVRLTRMSYFALNCHGFTSLNRADFMTAQLWWFKRLWITTVGVLFL